MTKELTIEAKVDNLNIVTSFLDEHMENCDVPMSVMMQIDVAVEELFVNIAMYAYENIPGEATLNLNIEEETRTIMISLKDQGVPFDPLAKEDPDVTLAAEDRQIGGLGIFMVKKSMDEVHYKYMDGSNIITISKSY